MRTLLNFKRGFLYSPAGDNGTATVDVEAGRLAEFQNETSTGVQDPPTEVVTSEDSFSRAEAAYTTTADAGSQWDGDAGDETESDNSDASQAASYAAEAVDDGTAGLAAHFGMTTEKAKAFPGGRAALVAAMQLAAAQRNSADTGRSGGEEQQAQTPKFEWKPFDYGFKDEDDIAPAVRDKLVAAEKHHQEQMTQLMTHLATTSYEVGKVIERDRMSAFDSVLNSLGPQFEKYVGKGSSFELDPNGDEMNARNAIGLVYVSMLGGAQGKWRVDRNMIEQAAYSVLGKKMLSEVGAQASDAARKEMTAASRSGTARPTHVKPEKKPADYMARAAANMGKLISRMNSE